MKLLLFIVSLSLSLNSFGCSFAPTYKLFEVTTHEHIQAPTPNFQLSNIKRGFNDGNGASCSDAGILSFRATNLPSNETGYIFKISTGGFEDRIFELSPITFNEFSTDGTFNFVWFDGNSDEQEPINITVEIMAISKSGNKSKPQYLEVSHPGIKKAWWKLW